MNNFIPYIMKPLPDELLFSWVNRLAKVNCITISTFSNEYFGTTIRRAAHPPAEIRKGFERFCDSLRYDGDKAKMYFSLSTLSFESLALPVNYQIRVVNNIFMEPNLLNMVPTHFYQSLNVCLDCVKEDKETYGEAYIHRAHQLTGVKTCHKHHKQLYQMIGGKNFQYNFEESNLEPVVFGASLEEENRYADYSYKLLNSGITSNAEEIKSFILNCFEQKGFNKSTTIDELKKIIGPGFVANRWKESNVILDTRQVVLVLMHLYPDVNELLQVLKPQTPLIERFYCDKCNSYYYSTNKAQLDGWGCSHCANKKTDDELFKEIVTVIGNGKYHVLEPFNSIDKPIKMFHDACEEEIVMKPRDFLFSGARCYCERYISQKAAKRAIEKNEGFKLVSFQGTQKHVKIYHEECGHEFQCDYNSFLKNPKCRHCELKKMTEETFIKEMQDLVGDEYTLISKYTGRKEKVIIRHNKCGHEQEYYPYLFLEGYRCSHCHEKVSYQKIKDMIELYSNGKYEIIEKTNQNYTILDHETKMTIILTPAQILQELQRPTPSTVLPIPNQDQKKDFLSPWGMWFKLCLEYKQEFGHFNIKKGEVYKEQNLGLWCIRQKDAYRNKKLDPEKIEKLKSIGFIFNQNEYDWNIRCEQYEQYVKKTGVLIPEYSILFEGFGLRQWIETQRKKKTKNKLSEEQIDKLLKINPNIFD